MVNGYVNAPKEFFDIPLNDILKGITLKPEDKLFNKFFEFVMAASHKVPMFAGTLYVRENEESPLEKLSINTAGTYMGSDFDGVGLVKLTGIIGKVIVIQAHPSEIIIRTE